ncbi:MAG: 3-deoxy-D-manno-octulosonic acid transferase [Fusobacteriaceae bacterium]|jgi:tRNA (guanine-N7-)-methyltransferase|nr:3-deoxy-D-manno-octulosonic acid transferase [Fusobacteriaceae bacterium]
MLYNAVRSAGLSILRTLFYWNQKKRNFFKKRLTQRFDDLPAGPYIWIHCASVGEINLSDALIRLFLEKRSERILLTCITDAGMAQAIEKYRKEARILLRYFPIDDKKQIGAALSKCESCLLVLVETELWPNLIRSVHRMPKGGVVLVNGRISDKSFGRYRLIRFFLKHFLSEIDAFYMQSEEDAGRVIELGAAPEAVLSMGNLKFDIRREPVPEEVQSRFRNILKPAGRKIFVAGSTRTGENEILLEALKKLPNTLLVIAPRHIENSVRIDELIRSRGFTCKRFSRLEEIWKNTDPVDVVLVDSIGKLKILYSLCDLAFVGGTLVNIGGHSLLEPLCYNKTPVFGPYLQNVRDISGEILRRDIGFLVKNADELVLAAQKILARDEASVKAAVDAFFEAHRDVASRTLRHLEQSGRLN